MLRPRTAPQRITAFCRDLLFAFAILAALLTLACGNLRAQQPVQSAYFVPNSSPVAVWAPSEPSSPATAPTAPQPADQAPTGNGQQGDEKKEGEKKSDQPEDNPGANTAPQCWNFHAQTTTVAQGDPGFPARYSGPNSLNSEGERQETLTADLFIGARLWTGAELHVDALMWQGFGLSDTFGIEAFPNGDAFKAGTTIPDFSFAHLFIRQTIGLGGEQENITDDQMALAGKQDISRLTFTVGRLSPTDIFDKNTYAGDAHAQFLNWAAVTNITWDFPSDTIGFTTGLALELNQPDWAWRYGFFQMPGVQNGFTADDRILTWPGAGSGGPFFLSWGMMSEFERRYKINDHPGAIQFLAWLNEADMASYTAATAILRANPPGPDVPQGAGSDVPPASLAFRHKYGFGLNWEQEVAKNVGMFSRLGWNDGHEEAWTYTDANWSASLGASIKGAAWCRPDDTFGLVGIVSGASRDQQEFLEAGGLGIIDGDGALNYDCEKVLETYYDFPIGKTAHFTMDYQFVADPAFNSARGPVSIFGVRLHWGI
jgi:high affinity Mn2+ porin